MGRRALAACLAGVLAVAPAGCQDLPSERAIPVATMVVRQFSHPVSLSVSHPERDETVDFEGEVRGDLVVRPAGGRLRFRLDGVFEGEGVGRSTGRQYRAAAEFAHRALLETLEPPLEVEIPVEVTVTSPEGPAWQIPLVLDVTLTEEDGRLGEIFVDVRREGSGSSS